MAARLKRLVILAVALAFLAGSWGSLLPCAMAQPHSGMGAGMASDPAQPKAPTLDCIGHSGCIVTPAIPALPPSLSIAPQWTAMRYGIGAPHLAGLFVEPDLFPPILAS